MHQCALQTHRQILKVICCIQHHIHHISRTPFLILSFLDFVVLVVKRGYSAPFVQAGHHCAKQINRQSALQTSQKEISNRIQFTFLFNPHNYAAKSIIQKKKIEILQNDPDTGSIFSQPPLIPFKSDKNTGNFLVRNAFQTSEQPGTFKCIGARCKVCPFIRSVEKIQRPKRSIKDH